MRRTDFYMKLVSAIVLAGVLLYFGAYLVRSLKDPVTTALAVSYSKEFGYETQGIIVRDESVIYQSGANIDILRAEGEKVGGGQAVAVIYNNAQDLQVAEELRAVRAQIEQLEKITAAMRSGNSVIAAKNSAESLAMELNQAVGARDFDNISALCAEFLTLTYYSIDGSGAGAAGEQLAILKNREYELESHLAQSSLYVYSDRAGVFSQSVDGYEYLNIDSFSGISVQELEKILDSSQNVSQSAIGKVINGIRFYYVAEMDYEQAGKMKEGSSVKVKFSRYYTQELEMRVESAGMPDAEGKCALILSSDRALSELARARKIEGEIIYSRVDGIRVPKKAIRLNENGESCVYTLTGARAELKQVEIIHEVGDYYIVKNAGSTDSLREGDEVIVSGKGLYDGKVVG